jgi:hypothetical protein
MEAVEHISCQIFDDADMPCIGLVVHVSVGRNLIPMVSNETNSMGKFKDELEMAGYT